MGTPTIQGSKRRSRLLGGAAGSSGGFGVFALSWVVGTSLCLLAMTRNTRCLGFAVVVVRPTGTAAAAAAFRPTAGISSSRISSSRSSSRMQHEQQQQQQQRLTRFVDTRTAATTTALPSKHDNGKEEEEEEEEEWDSDVNYEREFPSGGGASDQMPDPALSFDIPKALEEQADLGMKKLGIDIGRRLDPLTEREAAELKAAAAEVINDAVAGGIDEIEKLRTKMRREIDAKRRQMEFVSELNARRESEKLLSKIDRLTEGFLKDSSKSRAATKLAAAADRSNEGRGTEIGVWGTVDGAAVVTESASLLGSVEAARAASTAPPGGASGSAVTSDNLGIGSNDPMTGPGDFPDTEASVAAPPRIVIVADVKQDAYAKKLVPKLTGAMQDAIPGLQVATYAPASTLPLGGNDAQAAVLFATSLSDQASVKNALDRLLRKTVRSDGRIGRPPTQLVLVTTVGTERYQKMPYSMQNMLGGGKLEKRRQMEEALIRIVRDRAVEPALDYTVCKLGSELKENGGESSPFELMPGDCLDGNTDVDTAAAVLKEAIAFQPSARNATLCCVGNSQGALTEREMEDWFVRLEGPEVYRRTLDKGEAQDFDALVEYLTGWADLVSQSKNLITPIRTEISSFSSKKKLPKGVVRREGVKLLFLPTATGKNYVSREEERAMEQRGGKTPANAKRSLSSLLRKEGGVEVLAEVVEDETDGSASLRVRGRRCNYADGAVIKELSEETILKRLDDSIQTWVKNHI